MQISDKMAKMINEQINAEQYSSHLYLQMAAQFEDMGLKVFAQKFYAQAQEETMHAMKMFKYLLDVGAKVQLKSIGAPEGKWTSVEEIITAARDHEIKVTNLINDLVKAADKESDYATRSFLQWFIDEQVEEVSSMEEILQLVKLAGPNQMFPLENRIAQTMAQGQ